MFRILINVLVACAMTGSVLSGAVPAPATGTQPLILPKDNGRITYRQASRQDILRRAEARVSSRAGALQPRQSATVYPTCSSGSPGHIPQSGFASFPEYSINTNSANLLNGNFASVDSQIACVMLCETTSGCTAGYYAGTSCYLRKGTVTGSAIVARPGTDRVAHLRGDCISLESQINNPTIMASCCNNPAPSTINRCTTEAYKNLGNYCLQSPGILYTSTNRLESVTVGGSNIYEMLKRCAAYCTNYTANGRTSSSEQGCTAATYAYNVGSGPNCFIYGDSPLSMSGSEGPYSITLIAGTCEQVAANNIPSSGGGCYSPQSGP